VAGLTTALVLARKGYAVTVVAQHLPGDLSIEYTSPWAVDCVCDCSDFRGQTGYLQPKREVAELLVTDF
jgi:glycine/D-amino acid oxidase-like deaminating enzyme